jgi:thioesterase domain-containing protein
LRVSGESPTGAGNGGGSFVVADNADSTLHNRIGSGELFFLVHRRKDIIVPLNAAAENSNSANPALYCVHPLVGTVDAYFRVAESFDPVPFFGVKAPLEQIADDWSVKKIADLYADALVAFQPEGTFFLGGWSAGGTLAHEIAVNLQKRGRTVGVLAIIDSRFDHSDAEIRLRNLRYLLRVGRGLPSWIKHEREMNKKFFRAIARRILRKVAHLRRTTGETAEIGQDPIIDISRYPEKYRKFALMLSKALREHIPENQYSGRVVVYEAEVLPVFRPSPVALAWRQFISKFDVVSVGGRHLTMMEPPNFQTIARDLKKRIVDFPVAAPACFEPDLARGLNDLSSDLADSGDAGGNPRCGRDTLPSGTHD